MAENWAVTGQRGSFATIGGRLQKVVVVSYRTAQGDEDEVELPADQFTAERAAALIEAEVAERVKLRNL
ncbi:MAG: hypothetical protein ACREN5_14670 [Gemmatimonadales bacterium]